MKMTLARFMEGNAYRHADGRIFLVLRVGKKKCSEDCTVPCIQIFYLNSVAGSGCYDLTRYKSFDWIFCGFDEDRNPIGYKSTDCEEIVLDSMIAKIFTTVSSAMSKFINEQWENFIYPTVESPVQSD